MQLKKWFVLLLTVVLSSTTFSLSLPVPTNDLPQADMTQVDQDDLHVKMTGIVNIMRDFENSDADDLTASQANLIESYRNSILDALYDEFDEMFAQVTDDEYKQTQQVQIAMSYFTWHEDQFEEIQEKIQGKAGDDPMAYVSLFLNEVAKIEDKTLQQQLAGVKTKQEMIDSLVEKAVEMLIGLATEEFQLSDPEVEFIVNIFYAAAEAPEE